MNAEIGEEILPISLLNAYVYCPRRFYYEYVQAEMLVNEFVLEGTLRHANIDEPGEQLTAEGDLLIRRVPLSSAELGLTGFADLVEDDGGALVPVEYKHGQSGRWLNDHVQLCAQALCLEERFPERAPIARGAIFYFGSRRRETVALTAELRERTRATIAQARELAAQGTIPAPLVGRAAARCGDCSLKPLCMPEEVRRLRERGATIDDAVFD